MMLDLEKVIKGLECCTNVYPSTTWGECKERNCSYLGKDCELAVMADALELLKAQEPRVMAIEEVKHAEAGSVAWVEWRREGKINSVIFFRLINKGIDDSLEFHVLDGFVAVRLACYGTEWRCWDSRPTDEQRKAVKWDD